MPSDWGEAQIVDIPEFQSIGAVTGRNIAEALADQQLVAEALKKSQAAAVRAMVQGGYPQQ